MKRRHFLGSVAAAASLGTIVAREIPAPVPEPEPKEPLPDEPLTFHMTGCHVTPAIIHRASRMKPTLYRMHSAQSFAVWQMAALIRDSVPEFTDITSVDWTTQRICGVPCQSDDDLPRDQIWLYRGRHIIAKIISLGIPYGYNS